MAQQKQQQKYYYSGTTSPKKQNPNRAFITVEVKMPHVKEYGQNPVMRLAYGCNFANEISVGSKVLVPPSRLNNKWLVGTVVSFDTGGYNGPIRYVAKLGKRIKR